MKSKLIENQSSSCGSAYAGLTAEIPASEKLLFDIGLIYINQVTIGEGSTMLHNINLPIAVKYDISGFRPKVGIYASYIPGVTSLKMSIVHLLKTTLKNSTVGLLLVWNTTSLIDFFIEAKFQLRIG